MSIAVIYFVTAIHASQWLSGQLCYITHLEVITFQLSRDLEIFSPIEKEKN